jgi:hypothetical protein
MPRILLSCRLKVRVQNGPHLSRARFFSGIDLVHERRDGCIALEVAQNGPVDKLLYEAVAFRDLTAPPVLGHREFLVEDFGQN